VTSAVVYSNSGTPSRPRLPWAMGHISCAMGSMGSRQPAAAANTQYTNTDTEPRAKPPGSGTGNAATSRQPTPNSQLSARAPHRPSTGTGLLRKTQEKQKQRPSRQLPNSRPSYSCTRGRAFCFRRHALLLASTPSSQPTAPDMPGRCCPLPCGRVACGVVLYCHIPLEAVWYQVQLLLLMTHAAPLNWCACAASGLCRPPSRPRSCLLRTSLCFLVGVSVLHAPPPKGSQFGAALPFGA
jgi:hypothetical protein